MTKIVAISDLHGFLPEIPSCDLLLIAGDICPVSDHSIGFQESWLDTNFRYWLRNIDAKKKVFIFGNHDLIGESKPSRIREMFSDYPGIYLQDNGIEFEGLRVYGSPYQPYFHNWAFNLYENDLKEKWKLIPDDTDILLVHGPPYGYGDKALKMGGGCPSMQSTPIYENTGSPSLTERIKEIKPKLTIHGHIHGSYGLYKLDDTIIANASLVNEKYELVNKPFIFNL